jgi:uncharacterized membrane protein
MWRRTRVLAAVTTLALVAGCSDCEERVNAQLSTQTSNATITQGGSLQDAIDLIIEALCRDGGSALSTQVSAPFAISANTAAAGYELSVVDAPPGLDIDFGASTIDAGGSVPFTVVAAGNAAPGTRTIEIEARNGGSVARTTISVTVLEYTGSYTLAAQPNPVSIKAGGQSATATVNITRSGDPIGDVTLTAQGLPAGATATFSPNPVPANATTSTMTVTFPSSAWSGQSTYPISIQGVGQAPPGPITRTAPVMLSVAEPDDFTVAANPPALTLGVGKTAQVAVSLTRTGAIGTVRLSTRNLPSGLSAAFAPADVPGLTSTLTLTAATSTVPGSYVILIDGSSGALTRTDTLRVTIAPPAFTLSVAPDSMEVDALSTAQATVEIQRQPGFTSAVSLTALNVPSGVSVAFTPGSAPGSSSILRITPSLTAPGGTSTITISGTSNTGETSTTTLTLVIRAFVPTDFALEDGGSVSLTSYGAPAIVNIGILRNPAFTSAITFSVSGLPAGLVAQFVSNPVAGNSVQLRLAAMFVSLGSHTITVTGTAGTVTRTTQVIVRVSEGPYE